MQSRVHVERVRNIPYGVQIAVTRDVESRGEERTLWVRRDRMTAEIATRLGADLEECSWGDVPRVVQSYLDN